MDVRERLIDLVSDRADFLPWSIIEDIADHLIANGVTITPDVPGHSEDDHNIMELCFHNGKEEGRKELKAEVLVHLLDQKTKVNGLCHAHVVELMNFVEGL